MSKKTVKCPNCGSENTFDDEGGRIIDCISCCFDETIPPVYEAVENEAKPVEEKLPEPEPVVAKPAEPEPRLISEARIIKRGCTFEVDDKGKVVRIVSNG